MEAIITNIEKLKGYRFPKEIIRHVVWLYHRFTLSLRDISELMLERGIEVSYESIREWGVKFGSIIGKDLKRRAPRRGDKWHLDEMCGAPILRKLQDVITGARARLEYIRSLYGNIRDDVYC